MRTDMAFYIFLLFVSIPQNLPSQVRVVDDSLFSEALNSYSRYHVLLPNGYSDNNQQYPILYLLHGLGGDFTNWVRMTDLVRYAQSYNFIIVTPDFKNSWYTNSPVIKNARFEDFFIKELIPAVEKRYRINRTKSHRAIAGLSMGGYGAIKFALKYPDKFYFAAGISPSIQFPAGLEDSAAMRRRSTLFLTSVRDAFGPVRVASWSENDIFVLAAQRRSSRPPYIYLSVGSQDALTDIIDLTHEFAGVLRKYQIPFEMHELPGGHNWKFWDKEIVNVLSRLTELHGEATQQ